ncbi:MAG: hypothetical protein ACXWC1_30090, partial [Burkholderiales bacterium]
GLKETIETIMGEREIGLGWESGKMIAMRSFVFKRKRGDVERQFILARRNIALPHALTNPVQLYDHFIHY